MMPLLSPLFLASQLVVSVADEVPKLDVTSTCRAESAVVQANAQGCMTDEQNARDALAKDWGQFAASDKTSCTEMTKTGGSSSYVELLSCLEMKRDARKLPKE
jgi:hypothetical protein